MVSWLRRIKVTTRIMALACLLVGTMVAVLSFLLTEFGNINETSLYQREMVEKQNNWISREAALIESQTEIQNLLQRAQLVQKSYSDMLFWYFDGSVTQYYESLNKAEVSADELEKQLSQLGKDRDAAPVVTTMLENLTLYRSVMTDAIKYYQQGRNNMAAAEISDAHQIVQDMNDQLLSLTRLFQKRLTLANKEVEAALKQTHEASLSVKQASDESIQRIDEITELTMLLLVFTVPVSVFIAFQIIISITRPLKRLREQLLLIENDNDLTLNLDLDGNDEIREMSEATQKLLAKIRSTFTDVGAMTSQLKDAADDSYRASLETYHQSTEQQQQSEGIASAATQLGASAEDIARTANDGLKFVDRVQHAAEQGQTDVKATAQSIDKLAEQFMNVETTVRDLVSKSESIGQVLDVIRSIAEQTNLLALNAAIEAARAGDQGRGFAVVADEVRTLAQRTSQSTDEIQQMVEALQSQSRNAIVSLDENRNQVDKGVQLSRQAEESLSRIEQEMNALISMNESIAVITSEQQQAVLSVDMSVQTVRELANSVENRASDSKTVNEQLNSMAQGLQAKLLAFRH